MRSLSLVLVSLVACACPHNPTPPPRPEPQTLELAGASVELVAWTLRSGALLAADRGDAPACAALESVGGFAHATAESLIGEASGFATFGEFTIDTEPCGPLGLDAVKVPALLGPAIARVVDALELQIGALPLTCEEEARARAALAYLDNAAGPLLEALAAGQIKIKIPASSAPLAPCAP